ncbi:serine/threonine protein phosphatase [Bacillus sp. V3-13]|uniref:metallophosphoesterase family protein n=1 Tax=Bacillus sp. V3-13 TaxID=2053728 RepID=UPI000C792A16|nr:metallophosphoesterase family protein [Bacillus sp. V3-13]PLR78629.1 serine/threonine protein phosphatase [Bacillus sp. V3-13]
MYYVISDIHGCHAEMMDALSHWDKENETLIVLGDLIDRGPDSLNVVQTLRELKEVAPDRVVVLKGNHDESFTAWLLDTPEEELGFYYMPSHEETVRSFYGYDPENVQKCKRDSRKQRGQHIRHLFIKELHFLARLPMVHETENCIFVHAGINLNIQDWRDDERCMNEIRNPFIYSKKQAPKRVFFGHTPTGLIRDDKSDCSIWMSDHGDKIGIDGGCVFGRQLNALKVSEDGDIMQTIAIHKKTGASLCV